MKSSLVRLILRAWAEAHGTLVALIIVGSAAFTSPVLMRCFGFCIENLRSTFLYVIRSMLGFIILVICIDVDFAVLYSSCYSQCSVCS